MATMSSYFNNCDVIARPHARLPDVFTLKSKKKKKKFCEVFMNEFHVCVWERQDALCATDNANHR